MSKKLKIDEIDPDDLLPPLIHIKKIKSFNIRQKLVVLRDRHMKFTAPKNLDEELPAVWSNDEDEGEEESQVFESDYEDSDLDDDIDVEEPLVEEDIEEDSIFAEEEKK
jgi:hypothetical protein